jgi:hypothetical protein
VHKFCIAVILVIFSLLASANEFEKEVHKADWIKEFLYKFRSYRIYVRTDATLKQKKLAKDILNKFLKQKDIEHIEPIAIGKDIDSPEIAKFNTACPERKPINMTRAVWCGPKVCDDTTDFTEEDWEKYSDSVKCTENMKIFNLTANNQDNYVLYCENVMKEDILEKKFRPTGSGDSAEAEYISFQTNNCRFSKVKLDSIEYKRENSLSGIFKYKKEYFIYYIAYRRWSDQYGSSRPNEVVITVQPFNAPELDFIYYGH